MNNATLRNHPERLYTPQFFQVFAAVACFMTGNALQFHFGEYLEYLDHDVDVLGRVLAIGMIGTLSIRFLIGRWIDRFGCRSTWLAGAGVAALAFASFPFVSSLSLIVAIRVVLMMAFATVMTTVAVFAAQIAPPHRRAESIGTIGMSGFLGIMTGPALGDWIFAGRPESVAPFRIFFMSSAACSLAAGAIVALLKMPGAGNSAAPEPPSWSLIRRHWPGPVMLIGVTFAMVFCMQMAFLERLADARGFQNIKVYFLVYAPTAMALRVLFRRLPERFGRTRTVVLGMSLLAIGLVVLSRAAAQWHLVLPGLLMGAGHSFVFPSMVDLAAARFPLRHRGLGTSCILGAGDVGMLVGFAGLGELFQRFGYTATLIGLAVLVACIAVVFAFWARRRPARPLVGGGAAREGSLGAWPEGHGAAGVACRRE
jgi:MFS family permease